MASVNFYVGVYYLYFYLKRRAIREHLPFALLCLGVGFYDVFSAGLYNSLSVAEGVVWQRLQLDSGIAIAIFLIWFTSFFTGQAHNRIVHICIAWFVAIFLACMLASPELTLSASLPAVKNINFMGWLKITYYEAVVGPVYQLEILSALMAFGFLLSLLIRYYRQTRYGALLLLIACLVTYFLGVANDSLVAFQAYSFIYVSEYAFFFIILAMAHTLLDRFVNLQREFEQLNVNLERMVHDRTEEINVLNEHLKNLADRDGLTGVYNRRFFNEYFEIEVRRAMNFLQHKSRLLVSQDANMNFGLAMIDIDHFKSINDTYGHLVGDDVIKQTIGIVEANIFSRDVLCRYGGDEFALLLTKTSNRGIHQAVEKIRKEIDEHVFVLGDGQGDQHITVSIGLVTFDEALSKEGEGLLKLADDRLLRAKSGGKNRIIYTDEAKGPSGKDIRTATENSPGGQKR